MRRRWIALLTSVLVVSSELMEVDVAMSENHPTSEGRSTDDRTSHASKSTGRWGRGPVAQKLGLFFGIAALAVLVLTLLGYLGELAWWMDVLNEGRMQLFGLALICAAALLVARAWGWFAVATSAVIVNGWLVVPWFLGSPPEVAEDAGRDLRLMVLNVRESNEGFEPVLVLLRRDKPDVVVLNEVDPAWLREIRGLEAGYEIYDTPAQGKFGVLLLSRIPIESTEVERFTGRWSPSIVARLEVDGRLATLIATHPPAPMDSKTWENRNEHLKDLERYVGEVDGPVLVAGDLNTTMWSPHLDNVFDNTRLVDTREGYGVLPTYPASRWGLDFPWVLQVPLDHVLASEEWSVLGCKTGPNVGSDHLPLIVDLTLRDVE